jgi:hypothetical protein
MVRNTLYFVVGYYCGIVMIVSINTTLRSQITDKTGTELWTKPMKTAGTTLVYKYNLMQLYLYYCEVYYN